MAYTKTTNFLAKDSLLTGDTQKLIKGSEIDVEFEAIEAELAALQPTELIVGDPGTEASGININGVTYESTFKVSDIDGTNFAQNILHRHSTTLEPLIVGARSNSNTSAHAAVTAGQNVFGIYGTGWAGSNYKLFGSISIGADTTGTISNTSAPGKWTFNVTPDGSVTPVAAMSIHNTGALTFGNAAVTRTNLGLAIGTDVQAYAAAASQVEMETGTEAALRSMSPLRVAQAIAALGGGGGSGIQPISASVGSNALTISASALSLDFRSTTLGSGTVTAVSGTPANLVISSGSTLGTTNAVQSDIAVLAINNAGTIELAAMNLSGGVDLSETGLITTTAEGGAGAADSATVAYSTTARTDLAYRVIGIIRSTQATAGTWATAPSLIQGAGGRAVAASLSSKVVSTTRDLSLATGTQDVTGFGFNPTAVIALGLLNGTTRMSWGFVGSNASQNGFGHVPGAFIGYVASGAALYFNDNAGGQVVGTISFIPDGIRISWVKAGAPTGTVDVYFMGMK